MKVGDAELRCVTPGAPITRSHRRHLAPSSMARRARTVASGLMSRQRTGFMNR